MVAAYAERQVLARDHTRGELGRHCLDADSDDANVDVAVCERLEQRFVVLGGEQDLDVGIRATQLAERLTERLVDRPGDPDAKPSAQHPAKRDDRIASSLSRSQRRAGVGEQRLARFRQADRTWVAVKQGLTSSRSRRRICALTAG